MNTEKLNPLLDLDPVVYAAGFAADAEIKKELADNGMDPDFCKESDYLHVALGNTKSAIEGMLQPFPDRSYYKGYLTGKGNFRETVATIKPYKGNRDPNHKPKYFAEIRDYILSTYDAELVTGQEADDAIGIEQYRHPDRSTVIVTIDKDLNMIPGWHFNPRKQDIYLVSKDEADRFFWWQMLVGDPVDNIPGINKVGPKTADKILEECQSIEELSAKVAELYKKQYGDTWEQAMEEVAKLLWIRRKENEEPQL